MTRPQPTLKCPQNQPQEAAFDFPVPINEQARLAALHDVGILDTPADERFDRLTRLAVSHFKVPVARISFVDHDRTWFKSCVGLTVSQAPRQISICSQAIMENEVLVATDLAIDPRFRESPQVTGKPHFRFYAGAPITISGGQRVGSVCLMDYQPHPDFSADDVAILADLAELAAHELQLHRQVADRDERLDMAEADLLIAQQAKARFMSIVSHELRTPLNAVLGFGQLIAEQKLGPIAQPNYVEYAQHICGSAHRLDGLIKRVLTYASTEFGDLTLSESVILVSPLAHDCVASASTVAKLKDVGITLDISPQTPEALYADNVQLTEIIMQLLDNAIAFSPSGGTVAVHLSAHDANGLLFRIADNGPGIPQARLDHVMNAFSQVDEELSRTHEGIGLGLPITKALAELHGGRLNIESSEDHGTVVEIRFPASRSRTQADTQITAR